MKHIWLITLIAIFFAGCASHTPAPVINRSPQASSTNDWRPNTYTVRKGDTLYSIGLEHGYDYREIAAANHIYSPFRIRIGQKLNFSSLNTKDLTDGAKPSTYENEDDVIVSAVDTEDEVQSNSEITPPTKTASPIAADPAATPVLTEPKAIREPYSLEALNRISPAPAPPTKVAGPTKAKPAVVEGVAWSWPTQGKVSARFNAASNKGINITGKEGQAITAASAGKIIYTGADLRGYGKLVIIKHSKTLLSVYAHNSKINVKEGQIIKAGQKIAEMGDTDTDKVKLHFEIRQKGKSVDPEQFLPKS